MACLTGYTLRGIGLDCNANIAGIKRVWLGYNDNFVITTTEASHTATIAAEQGATDAKLYQYDFAKQTGSLNSTLTKDDVNGTRYYTNELVLSFNKLEGAKHIEVEAMAAEALIGIVEDNNGKYWVLGAEGGYLSATATSANAGQNYGDKNGYDVTLSAMSSHLPYEIDYDDFKSLIA